MCFCYHYCYWFKGVRYLRVKLNSTEAHALQWCFTVQIQHIVQSDENQSHPLCFQSMTSCLNNFGCCKCAVAKIVREKTDNVLSIGLQKQRLILRVWGQSHFTTNSNQLYLPSATCCSDWRFCCSLLTVSCRLSCSVFLFARSVESSCMRAVSSEAQHSVHQSKKHPTA